MLIFGGNFGSIYNLVSYGEVCLLDFGNDEILEILTSKSKDIEDLDDLNETGSQKETIHFLNEDDTTSTEEYEESDESNQGEISSITGVPIPPPNAPQFESKPKKKKIKTKKFHYFPIPKKEFENSIFNVKKISKESKLIKLNEIEICEKFAINPTKNGKSKYQSPKLETISLISSKRAHSLAIQIKALKLSIDEILELILESSLEVRNHFIKIIYFQSRLMKINWKF